MRIIVFICILSVVNSGPQGYNYQVNLGNYQAPNLNSEQIQLLQQYQQQVQSLPLGNQFLIQPDQVIPNQHQTETSDGSQTTSTFPQASVKEKLPEKLNNQENQNEVKTLDSAKADLNSLTSLEANGKPDQVPAPLIQNQPRIVNSQKTYYNDIRVEPQSQSVKYNKEFYYHAAPQEDFDQPKSTQDELNQLKKNIQVVFIKAPEQTKLENAVLNLAKQSIEQQTAIYVLTKQHDVSELANKLQDLRSGSQHKPEVVFVKYKTPADAEQAQRTIQAQYEHLDGPNSYTHAGPSLEHSFVDSAGGIDLRRGSGFKLAGKTAPQSTYLPPSLKRK